MDLLLQAAGLKHEGNDKEQDSHGGLQGSSTMSTLSDIDGKEGEESLIGKEQDQMDTPPVGGECPSKRKRLLTDDDPTSDDSGTSKKQSSDQHNENERKRRKSMKFAVHTLRDQLTHRTRKPAVNAVLKAAYDEIQELKSDEREKEGVLEELKKKNVVLKYLLEKATTELKQQSREIASTTSASDTSVKPHVSADVSNKSARHSPGPPSHSKDLNEYVFHQQNLLPLSTPICPPSTPLTTCLIPSVPASAMYMSPRLISPPSPLTLLHNTSAFIPPSNHLSPLPPVGMCTPPSFYPSLPFLTRNPLSAMYYPPSAFYLPNNVTAATSYMTNHHTFSCPGQLSTSSDMYDKSKTDNYVRNHSKKKTKKRTSKEPKVEIKNDEVPIVVDTDTPGGNSEHHETEERVQTDDHFRGTSRTSVITDYRKTNKAQN